MTGLVGAGEAGSPRAGHGDERIRQDQGAVECAPAREERGPVVIRGQQESGVPGLAKRPRGFPSAAPWNPSTAASGAVRAMGRSRALQIGGVERHALVLGQLTPVLAPARGDGSPKPAAEGIAAGHHRQAPKPSLPGVRSQHVGARRDRRAELEEIPAGRGKPIGGEACVDHEDIARRGE